MTISKFVLAAVLASGLAGHPVDGQLPSDWGWSLLMIGGASLFAFGYVG